MVWSVIHILSGIISIVALHLFLIANPDTTGADLNLLERVGSYEINYLFLLPAYFTIYAFLSSLFRNTKILQKFTTLDSRLKVSKRSNSENFRSSVLSSLITVNVALSLTMLTYDSVFVSSSSGGIGSLVVIVYVVIAIGVYSVAALLLYLLSLLKPSIVNIRCRKFTLVFQLSLLSLFLSVLLLINYAHLYNQISNEAMSFRHANATHAEVTEALKDVQVGLNTTELESIIEKYSSNRGDRIDDFHFVASTFTITDSAEHLKRIQAYNEDKSPAVRASGLDIPDLNKIRNDLAKHKMLEVLSTCVVNPRLITIFQESPAKTESPKSYLISDEKVLSVSTYERNGNDVLANTVYDTDVIGVNDSGNVTLCNSTLSYYFSETLVSEKNKFSIIPSRNCHRNYSFDFEWNSVNNACMFNSTSGLTTKEYNDLKFKYYEELVNRFHDANVDISN